MEDVESELKKEGYSLEASLKMGTGQDTPIYHASKTLYPDRENYKSSSYALYRKIERHLKSQEGSKKAKYSNKFEYIKSIESKKAAIMEYNQRGEIIFNSEYLNNINELFRKNDFMCTIKSNTSRINNGAMKGIPKLVIYLDCMHVFCRQYKIEIYDVDTDILALEVYS